MKILALDFSSPQRSVAVVCGSPTGAQSVAGEVVETGAGRELKPLGMIEAALREAQLEREQIECLAIGLGPGSYTGIRAAIALAQGWQLASRPGGRRLLGVSSAECVAAQAQADGFAGRLSVVIDAQREEFYLADYEISAKEHREVAPLRLASLAEVRERGRMSGVLTGPEVTRWFPEGRRVFPRAAMVGTLALGRNDFVRGEKLEPIYLRETKFVKASPPRVVPSLGSNS